eukprot:5161067-Karenia_brevis.AAC.1
MCPWMVRELVRRSAQRWQWKQLASHSGLELLGQGVVIEPLLQYLRNPQVPFHEGVYMKSAMVGGQWPQQRRREAGYAECGLCKACSAAEGTLHHRHFQCDGSLLLRHSSMPAEVARVCGSEGFKRIPSFGERGLLPEPSLWRP